jgi:uncharacterized protein YmfQ (DUF2313 family)
MDILQLIPKGKLWNGRNTKILFIGLGDGIKRVKNDAKNFLSEIFPDETTQYLSDWMRICNSKTRQGVLSTLAATGGNTDEFFLEIARKFDPECQILRANPGKQFVAGISSSGMSLSQIAVPRFWTVFLLSVEEPLKEMESLFQKLKPAHVRFVYLYKRPPDRQFTSGISTAGEALNASN